MHRVLYRKWRPHTFDDVVGQQAITSALSNQILSDKIGHAYLFTGTRGTGKTTCAKIFAKAVNCENRDGASPCGKCEPCLGLENGSILDVSEIDAASNNSVDDVRTLRDETMYRPSRCQYRVYIIDEVHMLSTSAFNALLKIMEEPPSHVIFILATTETHKVPATILSRCQRYDFRRISPEDIAQRLLFVAEAEKIDLTAEAADLIARLADGALRDAISLLDTCAGLAPVVDEALVRRMAGVADKGYLFEMSAAVTNGDLGALMQLISSLREQSIDVKRLTEELIHHYRSYLMASIKPDGSLLKTITPADCKQYISSPIGEAASIQAIQRLVAALDRMSRSPDPRIELELALFDLAGAYSTQVKQQAPPTSLVQTSAEPSVAAPVATQKPTVVAPLPQKPVETAPTVPSPEILKAPVPPPQVMLPDDGTLPVFEQWQAVVQQMATVDRMLYSYMQNSSAYTDGKRVLIDGGDMFLTYMRDYADSTERIKDVIQQVSGTRYAIGPYTGLKASQSQPVSVEDTLKEWQDMGVEIQIE